MADYSAALATAAQEFLQNTNKAYDECSSGIAELDRIIVSVPASRTDTTRAYLIPMLYAYWERFFRISFSEYLRVLSSVTAKLSDCHVPIALLRVRRELSAFAKDAKAGRIHELSDSYSFCELSRLFEEFSVWLRGTLAFRDPEKWVTTGGNVQFTILEKNCQDVGLAIDSVKQSLRRSKSLFQELKDLVDQRNSIAHGETFEPVSSYKWEQSKSFVLEIMNAVQLELHQHLQDPAKALGIPPAAAKPVSGVRPGQFADEELAQAT
jgi:hypothetical protein